ncbi:MAG: hypothetical protein ACP6IS_07075 [Candidatus Asgardarchaeia archaeon]
MKHQSLGLLIIILITSMTLISAYNPKVIQAQKDVLFYEIKKMDAFFFIRKDTPNVYVVYNLSYVFYSGKFYQLRLIIDWDNFDMIENISIKDSLGVIYEENINRFPGTFYIEKTFGRIEIIWFFESFIVRENQPVVLNFTISFTVLNLIYEKNGKDILDFTILSKEFALDVYDISAYFFLPKDIKKEEIHYEGIGDANIYYSDTYTVLEVSIKKVLHKEGLSVKIEMPHRITTTYSIRRFINEYHDVLALLVIVLIDGLAAILWIIRGRQPKPSKKDLEKIRKETFSLKSLCPALAYAIVKDNVSYSIITVIAKTLIKKGYLNLRLDPTDPVFIFTKKAKEAILRKSAPDLKDIEYEFLVNASKLSPNNQTISARSLLTHVHYFDGVIYDLKQSLLKEKIYYTDPTKLTQHYMNYFFSISAVPIVISLALLVMYISSAGLIFINTLISLAIAYKIVSKFTHVTKYGILLRYRILKELNNLKIEFLKLLRRRDLNGALRFIYENFDWFALLPKHSLESITYAIYKTYIANLRENKPELDKKDCRKLIFSISDMGTYKDEKQALKLLYCLHHAMHQIRILQAEEEEEEGLDFQQLRIQRVMMREGEG